MNIGGFKRNAEQTASMTFTLSRVLYRQNPFPSILPFELIMFQQIKEQTCYILFCYSQFLFFLPLLHFKMLENEANQNTSLLQRRQTRVEGEKSSLQRDQKIN